MSSSVSENTSMSILISDESERIARILEFLTYSGIDAIKSYDSDAEIYQLLVPDKQYDKAASLLHIYMEQEPDEVSLIDEPDQDSDSPVFSSAEAKYKDHSSSASSFLTVGILSLAILILCSAGLLPIPLTWESQPVMFAGIGMISVIFLFIGMISLKKAKAFKSQMSAESNLEAKIIRWFTDTYTKDQLDRTIEANEGEIPRSEILCLKRLELIRSYLLREYPSLSASHADALSETLYQTLYES